MKRDPRLHGLSHHHHYALVLSRHLRLAAADGLEALREDTAHVPDDAIRREVPVVEQLVDEHQGRGFGAAAIAAALSEIRAQPGCSRIVLSYDRHNTGVAPLYASFGFRPCGTDHEGSPMMELLTA